MIAPHSRYIEAGHHEGTALRLRTAPLITAAVISIILPTIALVGTEPAAAATRISTAAGGSTATAETALAKQPKGPEIAPRPATGKRGSSLPIAPKPAARPDAKPAARPKRAEGPMAKKAMPVKPIRPRHAVDECGGAIPFGTIRQCAIGAAGKHTYTVTTTVDADELMTQFRSPDADATVTDPEGSTVCYPGPYPPGDCRTGTAGIYTVTVTSRSDTTYTFGIDSYRTPSACTTLPAEFFSWASPGRAGALPAGSPGHCFTFTQAGGSVLHADDPTPDDGGDVQGVIRNAAGDELCTVRYTTRCALTGAGPYRLFLYENYAAEASYLLRLRRVTNPDGCRTLPVAPFGDPGDAVGTGTLKRDQVDCLTVPAQAGQHVIQARYEPDNGFLSWSLHAPDGQVMNDCHAYALHCAFPTDGTYTLLVTNTYWDAAPVTYRIGLVNVSRNDGCGAQTSTDWNRPVAALTQTSPVQVNCTPFDAAPGDQIIAEGPGRAWIVDAHGAHLCPSPQETRGCVLTGDAPYRALSYADAPGEYRLIVRRLNNAVGCAPVALGRYGTPPAPVVDDILCRALTVPAPGKYIARALNDDNSMAYAPVYDADGKELCEGYCTFERAGTYTLVPHQLISNYVTAFLRAAGDEGCVKVTDNAFTSKAYKGSFTAAGEYDCLEVPTPAGARLAMIPPIGATGTGRPAAYLIDSTGTFLCDMYPSPLSPCSLDGTAPFRIVLHPWDGDVVGNYTEQIVRTDAISGCNALPAGRFGADAGAIAQLTPEAYSACLHVAPGTHTASELLSFARTAGSGTATFAAYSNDTGALLCDNDNEGTERFVGCHPGASKGYTVVLSGATTAASYKVSRRDLTATAVGCPVVTSTTFATTSATGTMSANQDFKCHRVTGAIADRYWIDTRDKDSRSRIFIFDAEGNWRSCIASMWACHVTGSRSFQIMVWPTAAQPPVPYRIDAWKVSAGASTPRECPAVPSAAYGFGPLTGALTDAKPAACVSVPVAKWDLYGLTVENPEGGTAQPRPHLITTSGISNCQFRCDPEMDRGSFVFVVSSGDHVGRVPYRIEATCDRLLCGGATYGASAVAPATGARGRTVTVTVTGTALHRQDTVHLTRSGAAPIVGTVTAVTPDRTKMTVSLNLTNAIAGAWTVTLTSHSGASAQVPRVFTVT